jgi:mxaA protein
VSSLHEALNTTAGYSLFSNNMEAFLAKKPAFRNIQAELNQLFSLSRKVFFESNTAQPIDPEQLVWLGKLCKQCRDCERGLIPDSIATSKAA